LIAVYFLKTRIPKKPQEKEMLLREIGSTDQAIDSLVYQLYSLTATEIKIVKGKSKSSHRI